MAKIVGIDLGTANTLLCTKGKGKCARHRRCTYCKEREGEAVPS